MIVNFIHTVKSFRYFCNLIDLLKRKYFWVDVFRLLGLPIEWKINFLENNNDIKISTYLFLSRYLRHRKSLKLKCWPWQCMKIFDAISRFKINKNDFFSIPKVYVSYSWCLVLTTHPIYEEGYWYLYSIVRSINHTNLLIDYTKQNIYFMLYYTYIFRLKCSKIKNHNRTNT